MITNEVLDEMTLQSCLSRIVSMLPSCRRKRPSPVPLKSGRNNLWKQFPLKPKPNFCPWFTDRSDSLTDELRNFSRYVKVNYLVDH